ncbi:hypothetical protein FQN60_011397 [Etheostoma spectabile]|uniref:Uncharacterized protein n=1 Tax=Etheostoma spectabile TaxID=54343 RepID=A0A5J5DRZ9_9PERO|nr:hypothetical protein FQN60_011397 [Etheostoma spectabile]
MRSPLVLRFPGKVVRFSREQGRSCAGLEPLQECHSTVASGRFDDPPHCPLLDREECGKISATYRHDCS